MANLLSQVQQGTFHDEFLGIAIIVQIGCQCILHQSCLYNATLQMFLFSLPLPSVYKCKHIYPILKIFSPFYKLLITPLSFKMKADDIQVEHT